MPTLKIMDIGGRKMGKRKKTPPETNFETSNPESINPVNPVKAVNPKSAILNPDFSTLNQDDTHVTSPGQQRSERQWSLIFVTAIATASVVFETLKEITLENTPPTMIKVCECCLNPKCFLRFPARH
jgi:hypothetical protein